MSLVPGADRLADDASNPELKHLLRARELAYIVAVAALTRWGDVENALIAVKIHGETLRSMKGLKVLISSTLQRPLTQCFCRVQQFQILLLCDGCACL